MTILTEKKPGPGGEAVRLLFKPVIHSVRRESASAKKSDSWLRRSLDRGIFAFFFDAVKIALKRPKWLITALRLFFNQRSAGKRRLSWHKQGINVPPFMILSVTDRCNLKCAGCYARTLDRKREGLLSTVRLAGLLSEAQELGVSTVLLAGGEPLTRPDLFGVLKGFPETTFALFTNGTLLDDAFVRKFRDQRNVIPVLSIEGSSSETDGRRGDGVFSTLESAMQSFRKDGLFFGCSVTVTKGNFGRVLDRKWVQMMHENGCRLFIYVEYVPTDSTLENLTLTQDQRRMLIATAAGLRKKFNALFVAFPGDEDLFGGCLAAGRGFIHVSPSGDLEPCPFSPYSDRNVEGTSLKRALRSPLLEKIRANHANLQETSGGCALWSKRDWVASLVDNQASEN